MNYIIKCKSFIFFIFFTLRIYALDGNTIISNASGFLNHEWKCNKWNARPVNADNNFSNNDAKYPFYPLGAAIGEDSQGNPILNQNDIYIGVAYGWGLGDTIIKYDSKLTSQNPIFLVGNYTDKINLQYYAGIDCSGLLARCINFPVLRVNPGETRIGSYYLLHPTTSDFIKEIFTEPIKCTQVVKGDILIREYYEEDTNGDGKISNNEKHEGHIGIAIGAPSGYS